MQRGQALADRVDPFLDIRRQRPIQDSVAHLAEVVEDEHVTNTVSDQGIEQAPDRCSIAAGFLLCLACLLDFGSVGVGQSSELLGDFGRRLEWSDDLSAPHRDGAGLAGVGFEEDAHGLVDRANACQTVPWIKV